MKKNIGNSREIYKIKKKENKKKKVGKQKSILVAHSPWECGLTNSALGGFPYECPTAVYIRTG